MITTADINIGTRFGGSVDVPFDIALIENDLQVALGRVRGTAIIDTEYREPIDDEQHWQYRFVIDATNQRVALERLELFEGGDVGARTDLERLDTEEVERGVIVEEYERALAQLMRRTNMTDVGGLTTTQGDGILSAVYDRYGEFPNPEIAQTEPVPFDSYAEIEQHFLNEETRQLWRALVDIDRIGRARATNLILMSKATELADLRDQFDDEEWDYIVSNIEFDSDC